MRRLVCRQQHQQTQPQTHEDDHRQNLKPTRTDPVFARATPTIDHLPFAKAISWRGLHIEEHDEPVSRRAGKIAGNEVNSLQAVLDSRFEDLLQLQTALSSLAAEAEKRRKRSAQNLDQEQSHARVSIPLVCMVRYLGRCFRVTTVRGSASSRGSRVVYGLENSTANPEESSLHTLNAVPTHTFRRGLAVLADHLGVSGCPPIILSAIGQANSHTVGENGSRTEQEETPLELRVQHAYDPSIGGAIATNLSVLQHPLEKVNQDGTNKLAETIALTHPDVVDEAYTAPSLDASFPLSISSQCRLDADDARLYLTRCSQLFPPIPPILTLWALVVPTDIKEPCYRLPIPKVMSEADACDYVAKEVLKSDSSGLLEKKCLFGRDEVQLLFPTGDTAGAMNSRATRLLIAGDPDSAPAPASTPPESTTKPTHTPAVTAKPKGTAEPTAKASTKIEKKSAEDPPGEAAAEASASTEPAKVKAKNAPHTHLVLGDKFWKIRIEGKDTIVETGTDEAYVILKK